MGNTPQPNWLKNVRTPTSTSCPSPITTPSVPPKKRWKLPDLLAQPEYNDHPLLAPYRAGGARSDNPYVNFYWDYYSQGKPCFAEMYYPDMCHIIDIIHENDGLAVLAHPYVNLKEKKHLLGGIIDLGIDGIEAFSSYHTPSQTADALAVAQAHGLFVTCGSDFHGKTKPSIALRQHGCTIPGEEMERQMEALLERVI
jgi:hypothetical protein